MVTLIYMGSSLVDSHEKCGSYSTCYALLSEARRVSSRLVAAHLSTDVTSEVLQLSSAIWRPNYSRALYCRTRGLLIPHMATTFGRPQLQATIQWLGKSQSQTSAKIWTPQVHIALILPAWLRLCTVMYRSNPACLPCATRCRSCSHCCTAVGHTQIEADWFRRLLVRERLWPHSLHILPESCVQPVPLRLHA